MPTPRRIGSRCHRARWLWHRPIRAGVGARRRSAARRHGIAQRYRGVERAGGTSGATDRAMPNATRFVRARAARRRRYRVAARRRWRDGVRRRSTAARMCVQTHAGDRDDHRARGGGYAPRYRRPSSGTAPVPRPGRTGASLIPGAPTSSRAPQGVEGMQVGLFHGERLERGRHCRRQESEGAARLYGTRRCAALEFARRRRERNAP